VTGDRIVGRKTCALQRQIQTGDHHLEVPQANQKNHRRPRLLWGKRPVAKPGCPPAFLLAAALPASVTISFRMHVRTLRSHGDLGLRANGFATTV
jgi:hypothetical protein